VRSFQDVWSHRLLPNARRFAVVGVLLLMVALPGFTEIATQAMADAYLQVSVFVAVTLAIFYGAESVLKVDLGALMARQLRWQPAIAAFLGALPGCGGAIVVVTQFTRGYASFGALISVLVATMGDAAFLLIARDPATAATVLSVSFVAGTLSGMIVDWLHGRDFLRQDESAAAPATPSLRSLVPPGGKALWFTLLVPGAVFGAMIALQMEPDEILGIDGFTRWFGFAGAALSILLWSLSAGGNSHALASADLDTATRVAVDTNFVPSWGVMAFLVYEVSGCVFGLDIGTLFQAWTPVLPAVAILVGFIPGCGPQIVVTTLYLAGAIPLSAQFANAIANDGDALFPAIALAPRAALLATLYSAIPALIVGYGWFALFE
jgi:hypothetical protein